jgi:hypothetical protein
VGRPNIVVQLSNRQKVAEFRAGIGDAIGIIALGPETEASWRTAGIDSFYLSVTRAERWGARPILPHTVAVLRTSGADREDGFPPFIITGFLLREGEPDTAEYCIPRIVTALFDAIDEVNTGQPGAIRTLGFFEFELSFKGSTLADVGHLLVDSLEAATGRKVSR